MNEAQKPTRVEENICSFYFSFLQNYTQRFWFLGDTQGAGFYDMHGTTLHLFVILFPVQYMEKRFTLETRESFLIKISEIQKPVWKKKGEENIFSDSKWCLRFGYGAENKICSIKETRAYCFILFRFKVVFMFWVRGGE